MARPCTPCGARLAAVGDPTAPTWTAGTGGAFPAGVPQVRQRPTRCPAVPRAAKAFWAQCLSRLQPSCSMRTRQRLPGPQPGKPCFHHLVALTGRERWMSMDVEVVAMSVAVDEIAPDIYRLSVYVPEADFMFNQFLVDDDEPLLFHTGPRRMFPLVVEALSRIRPVEQLRWITFGHLEADECGAMNLFLAAAPRAQVAHGRIGCEVSIDDLADRPPRPLDDGELVDLGGTGCGTSRPRMFRTAGMPGSTSTKRQTCCSAGTCSPQLVRAAPSWRARWLVRPCEPKTCSQQPASRPELARRCVAWPT